MPPSRGRGGEGRGGGGASHSSLRFGIFGGSALTTQLASVHVLVLYMYSQYMYLGDAQVQVYCMRVVTH